MLYFSRWKAIATLLTALFVCLFAVPNFFPAQTVKSWPKWAQRHLVLGLDLQGGSHILFEVDINDVRKQKAETLRDDVRNALRGARLQFTGLVIRDLTLDFRKPARLDDELQVSVVMTERRSASFRVEQQIVRGGQLLVGAHVRVACLVASSFRPRPLPEWLAADRP